MKLREGDYNNDNNVRMVRCDTQKNITVKNIQICVCVCMRACVCVCQRKRESNLFCDFKKKAYLEHIRGQSAKKQVWSQDGESSKTHDKPH